MPRNDGGPAFPRPAVLYPSNQFVNRAQDGMSLRDYFAAHAPLDPAPWFCFDGVLFDEPFPPAPAGEVNIAAPGSPPRMVPAATVVAEFLRDPYDDLGISYPALAEWEVAYIAWRDRRYEHSLVQQRARYVAWRWAYADAMLEGRAA